jgi:site-specific DNA recombinase
MSEAVIYVRISEDRHGGGLGVARQEKDCRALAERLGWKVTRVFKDNDISAYSGKTRDQYELMRGLLLNGSVKRVLAWHTDRLHRTPRELEDYIEAAAAHGAVTHTVQAGLVDLSTPGGMAMARTLCAWARYESDIKSVRTKAWARQRAEHGKIPGGIRPYGWHDDRINLKPSEHAVIVEVAQRLTAGESLRGIASDLNRRNLSTVTGRPWSSTVIRAMMLRPRMAGWRTLNGEVVARGEWQPALDEVTWQRVKTVLTAPGRRSGGNGARVNLLTGLAVCHYCDQPVTIQYGGASRPERSRNAYGCRGCGTWRAQPALDEYVEEAVITALEEMGTEADPGVDQVLVARIERLRNRIIEADEAFADDEDITPEQHRRIIRSLRSKLAAEEAKIAPSKAHVVGDLIGPDARRQWEALPLDRKRAVIDVLMEVRILRAGQGRRTFRPETVQIVLR